MWKIVTFVRTVSGRFLCLSSALWFVSCKLVFTCVKFGLRQTGKRKRSSKGTISELYTWCHATTNLIHGEKNQLRIREFLLIWQYLLCYIGLLNKSVIRINNNRGWYVSLLPKIFFPSKYKSRNNKQEAIITFPLFSKEHLIFKIRLLWNGWLSFLKLACGTLHHALT